MSYFNRLTEIIACNLTELLSHQEDPVSALPRIIAEMEEGLQGAVRSVGAATASAERVDKEIRDHRRQISELVAQARTELTAGREEDARNLLVWKRQVEDVVAGLQQQWQAAVNTRDHLTTTLRAVESRLSEARRRLAELTSGVPASSEPARAVSAPPLAAVASVADARAREVDLELEQLKRELCPDPNNQN